MVSCQIMWVDKVAAERPLELKKTTEDQSIRRLSMPHYVALHGYYMNRSAGAAMFTFALLLGRRTQTEFIEQKTVKAVQTLYIYCRILSETNKKTSR